MIGVHSIYYLWDFRMKTVFSGNCNFLFFLATYNVVEGVDVVVVSFEDDILVVVVDVAVLFAKRENKETSWNFHWYPLQVKFFEIAVAEKLHGELSIEFSSFLIWHVL